MRVVGDENNSQSFRINGDQAPIEDASSIERERERRPKLGISDFNSLKG